MPQPPRAAQQTQPPVGAATAAVAAPFVTGDLAPTLAAAGTAALSGVALAKAVKALIAGFDALAQRRFTDGGAFVMDELRRQYPERSRSELARLVAQEERFEKEFRRKMRARLERDLPGALGEADTEKRLQALKEIFDREKRFTVAREEAMFLRALGKAEAMLLKKLSPKGAYWKLSPHVQEHTLDCLAMGEKFWPWEVLDGFQPPVHHGCACWLLGLDEAVAEGLMEPDQIPDTQDAIRRARQALADAASMEEALGEEAVLELIESFAVEEAGVRRLHKGRERKALRYAKGFEKGGEFRPTRGGDPGARVLRRLFQKPVSPARARRDRASSWAWVNGQYTRIPEADHWERKIAGHTYVSPSGGTNVYKDGKLLDPLGEKTGVAVPKLTASEKVALLDDLRRHANVQREALRAPFLERDDNGIHGPVKVGDPASALLALTDAGYVPDRVSPGVLTKLRFRNVAADREVTVGFDGRSVTDVDFDPHVAPLSSGVELKAPPASWEEHRQDAIAWAHELAQRFGSESRLTDFRVDGHLADHAGRSEWSGEVGIGVEAPRSIEDAAGARAAGSPLTEEEKRGLWQTYWTTAHEISHAVNATDPFTFIGSDASLEEALAEEVAHVLAVERLTEQGQTDVLDWRKRNPDALAVKGVYRLERGRLARLLDEAGIKDPFDRRIAIEDLKFRTDPAERKRVLGEQLMAAGVQHNLEAAMMHVEEVLRPAPGNDDEGGTVLDPMAKSPGMQHVGNVGYGRFHDARLTPDRMELHLADGGQRRIEKLPIPDSVPELKGMTDGTAIARYDPGQEPTAGLLYADGTPKSFRYIDSEARAKMILRAFTGKGSPGDFGLRDIYSEGDNAQNLADKLHDEREWTTIKTVPVKRRFDGSYGVGWPGYDGRRLSALGDAKAAAETALIRAAEAPAIPPPASPGNSDDIEKMIKAVGKGWWNKITGSGQGELFPGEQDMLDKAFGDTEREQETGTKHPDWEPPKELHFLSKADIEDVRNGIRPSKVFKSEEKFLPPGLKAKKGGYGGAYKLPKVPPDPLIGTTIGGDPTAKKGGIIPNYDATKLKLGKVAGGSNGARWAFDDDEHRWLVKAYRGDEDRVATELLANRVYDAIGAPVAPAGTITIPPASTKPQFRKIADVDVDEPELPKASKDRNVSTGMVVVEDGRVWIYEPKGHFGGYEHTFPKGRVESGLTPQQNAHKELFEETGLHAHITGFLGDYEGDTGVTRYYLAVRTGGEPHPDDPTPHVKGSGNETASVKLADPDEALSLLNRQRDKEVISDALKMGLPSGTFEDEWPVPQPTKALAYPTLDGEVRNGFKPSEALGEHYMADALVGNWDFVGMSGDNVLWDENDQPIRIDQGGTFELRAQGGNKPYGPVPTEVWTMLSKGQGKRGVIVSEESMREQAKEIGERLTNAKINRLVNAAPFRDDEMRERIRENLKARVGWMRDFAAGRVDLPRPLEGEDAHDSLFESQADLELYPEQEDALYAYAEGMAGEINDALKHKKRDERGKMVNRAVDELDSLMRKAKTIEDVIAYVSIAQMKDGAYEDLVGKTLEEKGYLGLHLERPASPAYLRIVVPEGSLALYAGMFDDMPTSMPSLLAARGARLRITKVTDQDGQRVLDATLSTQASYKPFKSQYKPPPKGGKGKGKGKPKPWEISEAAAHSGAMVALYPSPALARSLAVEGGEPAEDLHITLAFLGEAKALYGAKVKKVVEGFAHSCPPIKGELSGVGKFTAGPDPVTYASADLPNAPANRQTLVDALKSAGIPVAEDHGFTPHMTLAYDDRDVDVPNHKLRFDKISVVLGGKRTDYKLTGEALQEAKSEACSTDEREQFFAAHGRDSGVTMKKDAKGYFVHTHRARSKSYPSPKAIPKSVVEFIESTG